MLKLAIIGTGRWGRNLVSTFNRIPDVEITALCDENPESLKTASRICPSAKLFSNHQEILSNPEIQAIVTAVDSPKHYEVALAALQHKKHVFVEKPLALSVANAEEILKVAKERSLKVMVGHLLKYHPCVSYIKNLISEGSLGDLFYFYSQRVNLGVVRTNENVWWSLAPHDIAVACYLFGEEPTSISVTGQAYLQKGIEDVAFAALRFPNDKIAQFHVSWLDPHKLRKMTLVTSQKMVVFDDMQSSEKVWIHDKGIKSKEGSDFAWPISVRFGDILLPRVSLEEPLLVECKHFVEAILHNKPILSDAEDGLRVVKILQAGEDSLKGGGKWVEIG